MASVALVGPGAVGSVFAAQNGIEQAERGEAVSGPATVVPGVVYCAAELLEPGHVRHRMDVRLLIPEGADADALVAHRVDRATDGGVPRAGHGPGGPRRHGRGPGHVERRGGPPALRPARPGGLDGAGAAGRGRHLDVLRPPRRPTHRHDALHGAVVRSADRDGIDVPVHRLLLALLATAAPVTAAATS